MSSTIPSPFSLSFLWQSFQYHSIAISVFHQVVLRLYGFVKVPGIIANSDFWDSYNLYITADPINGFIFLTILIYFSIFFFQNCFWMLVCSILSFCCLHKLYNDPKELNPMMPWCSSLKLTGACIPEICVLTDLSEEFSTLKKFPSYNKNYLNLILNVIILMNTRWNHLRLKQRFHQSLFVFIVEIK